MVLRCIATRTRLPKQCRVNRNGVHNRDDSVDVCRGFPLNTTDTAVLYVPRKKASNKFIAAVQNTNSCTPRRRKKNMTSTFLPVGRVPPMAIRCCFCCCYSRGRLSRRVRDFVPSLPVLARTAHAAKTAPGILRVMTLLPKKLLMEISIFTVRSSGRTRSAGVNLPAQSGELLGRARIKRCGFVTKM